MNLWRMEDERLKLRLHPGQARAWDSERRFVFVLAGTQGGKTAFGPWWLWREIQRCGAGDYLAVTTSFDLFKLKMLPETRTVFENILGIGRFWAGERVIELCEDLIPGGKFHARRADDPMWGRIILRSAQGKGGLEAATAQAAWVDEVGQDEFALEDWEAVQRRLSLAQGRVLGTTTVYNLGWLKHEVYDRWVAGDPDYHVIQFPSSMNPAFPTAEFERMRQTLPTWKFRMFYEGQFARPAGLIYGDFDEEVHVVEPFAIPKEWPRYVGIDFGGANVALIWIAEDTERAAYYIYRETLTGGKSTHDYAREALAFAKEERVVNWWGGAKSEGQQRRDWRREGVHVRQPPVGDVEAGIDRVIQLLREKRLFVFRSCRGIIDEFGTYKRKLDDSGQPTDEIQDKRMFHRLDALRYLVAGILEGRKPLIAFG